VVWVRTGGGGKAWCRGKRPRVNGVKGAAVVWSRPIPELVGIPASPGVLVRQMDTNECLKAHGG